MGFNLQHLLTKYSSAGSFLRELTDVLKRVNDKDGDRGYD